MHLISLKEWSKEKIEKVIDKAIYIKQNEQDFYEALKNKSLAMLFQKTSTRTRVSFEVAMTKLGGHALYIRWEDTNFTLSSSIKDEIRYLSNNTDIIMARLLHHKDIEEMSRYSKVPVINGCCEKFHPCQIIADMMTIKEECGKTSGINLVYIGVHNNIANTLVIAASTLKFNLTLVTGELNPKSYDKDIMTIVEQSPYITKEHTLDKAIKNADILYTDSWVDMEYFMDKAFEKEKERRIKKLMPYQINSKLISKTNALIMHDMPMHEGYEITREAIDSERSIIFKQSANRLHAQRAILLEMLNVI